MKSLKTLAACFLILSATTLAHANTKTYTYCYKLPRIFGDDIVRIRAEYVVKKRGQHTMLSEIKGVSILSGRMLDYAYVADRSGSLRMIANIGLLGGVPLKNGAMVERLSFVSPIRALGGSQSAFEMNKKIAKSTGIHPSRPHLQALDSRDGKDNRVLVDIAPVRCPKSSGDKRVRR